MDDEKYDSCDEPLLYRLQRSQASEASGHKHLFDRPGSGKGEGWYIEGYGCACGAVMIVQSSSIVDGSPSALGTDDGLR